MCHRKEVPHEQCHGIGALPPELNERSWTVIVLSLISKSCSTVAISPKYYRRFSLGRNENVPRELGLAKELQPEHIP
jgi:hypothetical protein